MSRRGTSRAREPGRRRSVRWVSIARVIAIGGQWVPTSWAARSALARAWTTSSLTRLPSARPRVRGDEPAHDLAHVARRTTAPVAAIPSRDEGLDLVVGRGLPGRYSRDDRDLGLFLRRRGRRGRRPEGLDGLAPGLDLAGQDGQVLVVGQRAALALLDVVGGAHDHAQDVATQRVTGAHGDGDIGLDAILKGHRSGTSGGRPPRSRWAADGPVGVQALGRAGPAQPTCVRAFFLRFASLRLRFTLGFS